MYTGSNCLVAVSPKAASHRLIGWEIYFFILQRKALVPNDFQSLEELEERLLGFQSYYEHIAQPFEWRFTRRDLNDLLHKINPSMALPERLAA
jgi:hypothetical protein